MYCRGVDGRGRRPVLGRLTGRPSLARILQRVSETEGGQVEDASPSRPAPAARCDVLPRSSSDDGRRRRVGSVQQCRWAFFEGHGVGEVENATVAASRASTICGAGQARKRRPRRYYLRRARDARRPLAALWSPTGPEARRCPTRTIAPNGIRSTRSPTTSWRRRPCHDETLDDIVARAVDDATADDARVRASRNACSFTDDAAALSGSGDRRRPASTTTLAGEARGAARGPTPRELWRSQRAPQRRPAAARAGW